LYVQRGAGAAQTMLGALLAQGYVSTTDSIGFPQSVPEASISGRGYYRLTAIPAAGVADVLIVVPAGVLWRVISILMNYTPPAAPAGSSFPSFFLESGGVPYYETCTITFVSNGAGMINIVFSTYNTLAPFSGFNQGGLIGESAYVKGGDRIRLSHIAGTGPPTYGTGLMLVEEWIQV